MFHILNFTEISIFYIFNFIKVFIFYTLHDVEPAVFYILSFMKGTVFCKKLPILNFIAKILFMEWLDVLYSINDRS